MFQATRRWFRRNRTSFAIGAGLLGVGYLAGQYVVGKISEARQRMSDERIAKENLRRRFEQNQEDCTLTVLALLPTLKENIINALPVEGILDELQQKKAERLSKSVGASDLASSDVQSGPSVPPSVTDEDGSSSFQMGSYIHTSQMAQNSADGAENTTQKPKKSKTQLWNEMKISSITRAFTLVYSLSLLSLLTRIQLNLLGRRNYLSSVVSLAAPPRRDAQIALENHDDDNFEQAYGNDFETNRQYLAFSWWLLHRGSKAIMEKVQEVVIDVFGPLNLREEITMEKLSQLTLELRKKIEGATEEDRRSMRWLTYLLPPTTSESFVLQESGIIPPPSPPASTSSSPLPTEISSSLRRLLDETSDLIDSPTFTHVLTLLFDSGFSLLIDSKIASQAFKLPPAPSAPSPATLYASSPSTAAPRIEELPDTPPKAKLASLLAVFCKQAHAIGAGDGDGDPDDDTAAAPTAPGPGNEYLVAMDTVRDLEAFAAVVYSSNFEWEAAAEQEEELEAGSSTAAAQESKRVSSLWGDSKRVSAVFEGEGRPGTGESLASGWEGAWTRALAREEGREAER
ncbi:Peroxin-3 [Viridothelium virens]|uniref:Peroxin-3 n=1 Tax=Viridothelium virens TaxID=1048519 RepID=A0A6A6H220_VIRVR|nr:Peroxin-3 [Viridothelium virens]